MKTELIINFTQRVPLRIAVEIPTNGGKIESLQFAHSEAMYYEGFPTPQPAPGVWEMRTIELPKAIPELQLLGALIVLLSDYREGKWGGNISQSEEERNAQADRAVRYLHDMHDASWK